MVLPYIDMNLPRVYMFPILNPPPTSLPILPLWVIPAHQARAHCIMHQTWTGIRFTYDNVFMFHITCLCITYDNVIHVSMPLFQIIPPSPSPTESKRFFIHLCLFCCLAYRVIITIFLNSIYMCEYTVLVFFFLAYFTLYNKLQFHPPH